MLNPEDVDLSAFAFSLSVAADCTCSNTAARSCLRITLRTCCSPTSEKMALTMRAASTKTVAARSVQTRAVVRPHAALQQQQKAKAVGAIATVAIAAAAAAPVSRQTSVQQSQQRLMFRTHDAASHRRCPAQMSKTTCCWATLMNASLALQRERWVTSYVERQFIAAQAVCRVPIAGRGC